MTPSRSLGTGGAGLRPSLRCLGRLSALSLLAPVLAGGSAEVAAKAAPPCSAQADSLYHHTRPAMGTTAEVYLYASDAARAAATAEAVFAEIERVEAALSGYRADSEVSRINRLAAVGPVTTDPEVFGLVERALAFTELTGGAFDVTVGPLVRAWGFFREQGHVPTAQALADARASTGSTRVILDESARAVRFLGPGVELDFGAMGKGWALDSAARILRRLGVEAALLGLGRSSYHAIGAPPGTGGWPIRIPDPDDEARILGVVHLRDRSLSTSGGTEKYFELDGRRYSHILDPRTGRPSTGVRQVTVVAPTATDADVLSTSLFVLGPEEAEHVTAAGLMAVQWRAEVEALFVTEQEGEGRVVGIGWSGSVADGRASRGPGRQGPLVND